MVSQAPPIVIPNLGKTSGKTSIKRFILFNADDLRTQILPQRISYIDAGLCKV
jgi:hypothetical protein